MKTRILILVTAALALLLGSGCMLVTRAQMDGKLPQIDAEEISVEANTIYGVTGTLTETDVVWKDGRKHVGSSVLKVDSPMGHYKRTIKGVSVPVK